MANTKTKIFLFLTITIVALGCNSPKQRTSPSTVQLVNDKDSCQFNSDSTYLLCKVETNLEVKTAMPPKQLEFIVVSVADNSILYNDKLQYASVEWIGNDKILINRGLGYLGGSNATEVYTVKIPTLEKEIIGNTKHIKNK